MSVSRVSCGTEGPRNCLHTKPCWGDLIKREGDWVKEDKRQRDREGDRKRVMDMKGGWIKRKER
jgi:hypothetical protein